MRTSYRLATTTVALAAAFPFGTGSAHADVKTEAAAASAYFSRSTPAKSEQMPFDPGSYYNQAGTDGVAPGNLAVAVTSPNQSDKESFLRFDLLSVPQGATITSAVVTVPLAEPPQPGDEPNQTNHSVAADPAKVKACVAGHEGFADGTDAAPYDEKPGNDCTKLNTVAQATADGKAYTFDVTPVANDWLTEINEGIALVPASLSAPFQVVFAPGTAATIALTYTVSEVIVDPVPVPQPFPPVVPGPTPPTGPTTTTVIVQPAPQPVPQAAPKPVVVTRPVTRAAGTAFVESTSLTAGFWLGALVGAALLGAVSLILGDTRVPVPVSGKHNGVGRALDERRRPRDRPAFHTSARPA